jgi:hypothetical protein
VVRRSPRNDSVRLLVSLIVIEAECEMAHVARKKIANVITKVPKISFKTISP